MSLRCLGSFLVVLGATAIILQVLEIGGNPTGTYANPMGSIFLDIPDLVCSGFWGGSIVLSAGISAILNKSAFQILAVLSILCGLAISGLHVWSLMKIWHWTRNIGPWGTCTDVCQLMIITRPLMCIIGLLIIFTNSLLLCQNIQRVKYPKHVVAGANEPITTVNFTSKTRNEDANV